MSKQKEEKIFYVGIKEPFELRKNLLESSKMIIKSLQKYQKFKDIKLRKSEYLSELKDIIKEIKKLNLLLNSKLPETDIKLSRTVLPNGKKEPEETMTKADIKKKNELEKLESELSSIESKLDSLNS